MKISLLWVYLCTIASSLFAIDLSKLPEPYKSVRLMPFNPHGWHGNGHFLEELINKHSVKKVVEVGSWMGLSTRDIARMLPEEGIVYAVDTWSGAPEEFHDPTFLGSPEIIATLYDQFLSNVIHANLTHKIIPMRMESCKAAATFSDRPDLIYIDGCHTYEAVLQDLEAWWPFVKKRGILCGDDYHNSPGVKKAVTEFALKNNVKAHPTGNFWRLEK